MTPITAERFTRFAVADWSGAKGSRHPGIAIAECGIGDAAPELVLPPGTHWSREAVLQWLAARTDDLLIGFDFSFAPPFVARGAYLPGDATASDASILRQAFFCQLRTREIQSILSRSRDLVTSCQGRAGDQPVARR